MASNAYSVSYDLQPNFGDMWHQTFPAEMLIIIFPTDEIKQTFIVQSLEAEYLGIFLDTNLTWRKEIEYSVQKF